MHSHLYAGKYAHIAASLCGIPGKIWDDPDEIDFDALPNQFVLKCNHNSGLGIYCDNYDVQKTWNIFISQIYDRTV